MLWIFKCYKKVWFAVKYLHSGPKIPILQGAPLRHVIPAMSLRELLRRPPPSTSPPTLPITCLGGKWRRQLGFLWKPRMKEECECRLSFLEILWLNAFANLFKRPVPWDFTVHCGKIICELISKWVKKPILTLRPFANNNPKMYRAKIFKNFESPQKFPKTFQKIHEKFPGKLNQGFLKKFRKCSQKLRKNSKKPTKKVSQ